MAVLEVGMLSLADLAWAEFWSAMGNMARRKWSGERETG